MFLDDSLLKWTAAQTDPSQAVNPKSEVRKKAFDVVTGGQPGSAEVESNLLGVRSVLVEHLKKRAEATTAVKTATNAATSQSDHKKVLQADVRKHTAVAAVMGTAVARAILSDGAPFTGRLLTRCSTAATREHCPPATAPICSHFVQPCKSGLR